MTSKKNKTRSRVTPASRQKAQESQTQGVATEEAAQPDVFETAVSSLSEVAPAQAPLSRPDVPTPPSSFASAQPRPRGPVTPNALKGPVLFVGGGRYESQANAQVRQTIMDGLVGAFGEAEVTMVDISGAANAVAELKPALVFSSGSYLPESTYFGEVSRAARKVGAVTAFWATEDPYEQDAHYQIDNDFDVIFSCDRWGHNFYGRKNVFHLPLGACPKLHYADILPDQEKNIDVLFCGVAFNSRKEVARNLLPVLRQLNIRFIGPGWGELGIGFSDARIEKSQLVDLYSRSKMVLNLGRSLHFENKQFMIAPSTPGPRTFEAAAAGAFQVFHEDTYELRRYYDADEIPVFSNRFDFERIVDRYLNDGAARLAASRKAQERTMNEHLYVHRIAQALDIMKREKLLP
ncbi:CgeB family protein [Oecophyllibacter saccharovorans]|nr:glycosyltransferase [Oecophyllibacter saccharovorans]